jgi:hypothetical protein
MLTGLSNGMDRHKSKDKVQAKYFLNISKFNMVELTDILLFRTIILTSTNIKIKIVRNLKTKAVTNTRTSTRISIGIR